MEDEPLYLDFDLNDDSAAESTDSESDDNDEGDQRVPLDLDEINQLVNEELGEDLNLTEADVFAPKPNRVWNDFTGFAHRIRPDSDATLNGNLSIESTPLEIFKSLFTQEILDIIVNESNKYAKIKDKKKVFSEVSSDEMWSFLALKILQGIIKKPTIKTYWSTDKMIETPYFSTVMSRNRFEDILKYFHLADETQIVDKMDRCRKFGDVLNMLFGNFAKMINPGTNLCIDESLVKFKGKLAFKIFNPMKRSRFGIKVYIAADCSSNYILNAIVYTGSCTHFTFPTNHNYGQGGAAVLTLLTPYFHKGHNIFIDNFFVSPALAEELVLKDTNICGTVKKIRKNMPIFEKSKLKKGEYYYKYSDPIVVERWMDKKDLFLLNTFIEPKLEEVENRRGEKVLKPLTVIKYNKCMGSIDFVDKSLKPYEIIRKSLKWYRKLFFRILDIAIWNAFVIYTILGKGQIRLPPNNYKTFYDFKHALIDEIITVHGKHGKAKGRPSTKTIDLNSVRKVGAHWPEYISNEAAMYRDCFRCKRENNCRKKTRIECKTCSKALCIECFKNYHTE